MFRTAAGACFPPASDSGTGQVRERLRIVFTDDAGRTWHVQYVGPAVSYG